MLIGYARVSMSDQNLDLQIDALKGANCEQVFTDTTTGTAGTSADGHLFYNNVTTTEYLPVVGGYYGYGANAGLWCMFCVSDASYSHGNCGSRLAKV